MVDMLLDDMSRFEPLGLGGRIDPMEHVLSYHLPGDADVEPQSEELVPLVLRPVLFADYGASWTDIVMTNRGRGHSITWKERSPALRRALRVGADGSRLAPSQGS
jgi:hypothetical protein